MSENKYKALLFDNDGTIVDTEECILTSFKYMMDVEFGDKNPDLERFKTYIGLPSRDQFIHYTDDPKKIDSMLNTYRTHNKTIIDEMSKNFEGLPEVLKQLKAKGYFLGVVTSKLHDVCVHGLTQLGIIDNFDYVQGSDDWNEYKPNPGPLLHACDVLDYKPEDVVYFGDSIYDIQSGNSAGCDTCAVTWGVFSEKNLASENPTYIAHKPQDILTLF